MFAPIHTNMGGNGLCSFKNESVMAAINSISQVVDNGLRGVCEIIFRKTPSNYNHGYMV